MTMSSKRPTLTLKPQAKPAARPAPRPARPRGPLQSGVRPELKADSLAIQGHITDRLLSHREALQALRRLIEIDPGLSPEHFARYTLSTLQDNPDISALSFSRNISAAQRSRFEHDMALRLGQPGFRITERPAA